jgi:hypothetical protein
LQRLTPADAYSRLYKGQALEKDSAFTKKLTRLEQGRIDWQKAQAALKK